MNNQKEKSKLRFISSWDDGQVNDLIIVNLLNKYKLPGIFFIPNQYRNLLQKDDIKKIALNFEIGGHTATHPEDLKALSNLNLQLEILRNKAWLERLINRSLKYFCYPAGRYDSRIIEAVRRAGFKYARTTLVLKIKERSNFEIDTTIHVYQRKEYNNRPWDEMAKEYALKASKNNGYFHLWGHSAEIIQNNDLNKLEDFFKWLNDNFIIIKEDYENLSS